MLFFFQGQIPKVMILSQSGEGTMQDDCIFTRYDGVAAADGNLPRSR